MKHLVYLAVFSLCTPAAFANGDGLPLEALFDTTQTGSQVCFAAQATPTGDDTTVETLALSLTKYTDSYNGTAPDNGFILTLDLGLTGDPDTMRIYGCCNQAGTCETGETCSDQPVLLSKAANGLTLDLSPYPKRGPTTVNIPEAERPTIGAQDNIFALTPATCPAN